ncbi:hypothetical protein Q5P01_002861 [Channa striata]|uniref:Ig-like domain-containing protein n=1 Tax=Channa striata TaxID=64152 RepID=A0AA88T6M1_CHASR|nr:hypothetical protein Q5P01_002861 [Channa striata]
MNQCLFLALPVLFCCSAECSETLPENILAFEGGDVILPCSFNTTANGDFPDVEWSKEALEPNVVYLYRDGCETVEMKNPVFQYRTSFIPKELKNGNISLRISNVQLSDAGTYQCMTLWRNAPRDITTMELVVGTVSKPKLSVVSVECGGLTLQCEAGYSLLEPEIMFLDDQGNKLPAEGPKRDAAGRGDYTVRRRLTLQSATNSITCRVQQPESHLVRDTDILIPADSMKFCFLTTMISVGGTIFVLEFVCGLALWFCKIHGKLDKDKPSVTRRLSDQSSLSITIERPHLDKDKWADDVGNSAMETLQREVAVLKSELIQKNVIIHQLLSDGVSTSSLEFTNPVFPNIIQNIGTIDHISISTTHSKPPKPASLPQNMGPTPDMQRKNSKPTVGQRGDRRKSCPAALSVVWSHSSLTNRSKKKLGKLINISSESYAQPVKNVPKIKRRHSLGISSTTQSANRYTVLADLTEESEPLI